MLIKRNTNGVQTAGRLKFSLSEGLKLAKAYLLKLAYAIYNSEVTLASVEILDPVSNQWVAGLMQSWVVPFFGDLDQFTFLYQ